ncbi:MAG: type II toxin-antitoxin system Phd/YefM family antitoxin [Polyangiaceae bacterium]|nr:type II toxin-antitoxin system Phd/YefM family antitoxin [Polyangiaceae bacterium]
MTRTSLVHAKAHLSELVDLAEHERKTVIILRRGKPAAAIVPIGSVRQKPPRPLRKNELEAFWAGFDAIDVQESGVETLLADRRRRR